MQVVVEARELRDMFRDLRPILRNSTDGGLIGFCVENNVLTCTCKNGVVYEKKFVINEQGPVYSTIVYRDIADFIPNTGTAELDITEKVVSIRAHGFSTSLVAAYGEIRPYNSKGIELKQCNSANITSITQVFQELTAVSRSLKMESPILIKPPVAICKYPSVWVETPFDMFETSISLKDLHAISRFSPKQYAVTDNSLEFINGNSMLAVPITPIDTITTTKDIPTNVSSQYELPILTSLDEIASFTRVVKGACKLGFFNDGYRLSYRSEDASFTVDIGACTRAYYTLETYVEYLPMFGKLMLNKNCKLFLAGNAILIMCESGVRIVHAII